jgi:hypothetical protein
MRHFDPFQILTLLKDVGYLIIPAAATLTHHRRFTTVEERRFSAAKARMNRSRDEPWKGTASAVPLDSKKNPGFSPWGNLDAPPFSRFLREGGGFDFASRP